MVVDARKVATMREEHANYLSEQRREAVDTISLMSASVARRAEQERARNGKPILWFAL